MMEIDRTRFLALVGTIGALAALGNGACAASAPGGVNAPNAAIAASAASAASGAPSGSPSATSTAAPPAPKDPPVVQGPRLRGGPCVEGGMSWPAQLTCDERPYEVDCERLAPPPTCGWATGLKRQCAHIGKYAKPVVAAGWIEGMLCLGHGDRRFVCQSNELRMMPRWLLEGENCRRADATDLCARLVKSCAGAKVGDAALLEYCKQEVGIVNDAGVKRVEGCLVKHRACAGRTEMAECFDALWSTDDD